jgi:ketosteroid isomerase-like protein
MQPKLLSLILAVGTAASVACATTHRAPTDNASIEQAIRRLDAAEADGLLRKDVRALEAIWAEDFTVNNPRNSVTRGGSQVAALIRSGTIDYSSFHREIEAILVHGETVIVMGNETITPVGNAPLAGQTVRRRYTHFWMRRNGEWRLTARHANVICPG